LIVSYIGLSIPFSAPTLLVWQQEDFRPAKKAVRWFVDGDGLTGALHVLTAPVVTSTSIIVSSNKTG